MALAGGVSPDYHSATTPALLTDTVATVVRSVATEACRLELFDPIDDFDQVALFLNNELVPSGGPMAGPTGIVSPSRLRGEGVPGAARRSEGLGVYKCSPHQ